MNPRIRQLPELLKRRILILDARWAR